MSPELFGLLVFVLLGCVSNTSWLLAYRQAIESLFINRILPLAMLFLVSLGEISFKALLSYSGVYYLLAVVFMVGVYLCCCRFLGVGGHNESVSIALSTSFSNLVLVGVPLFLWLGNESVISLIYMIIPFHSFILFMCASLLAAVRGAKKVKRALPNVPLLSWAILVGFVLSKLQVWQGVEVAYLKSSTVYVLQFGTIWVLSARLTANRLNVQGIKAAFIISLTKVVLMPAFFFVVLSPFSLTMTKQICLLAGLPIGLNTLGFSGKCRQEVNYALSLALVISSLLSLITIPLIVYYFEAF